MSADNHFIHHGMPIENESDSTLVVWVDYGEGRMVLAEFDAAEGAEADAETFMVSLGTGKFYAIPKEMGVARATRTLSFNTIASMIPTQPTNKV
jgi:hypothetical protein